ncbi:methionine ABC transporter substrate-binding protein [Klebsiella pneumoniae]|uniref:Methionine ABC transporter substrate-binding protein n=1 Tax=Klebsiella pneumoniae TaxID=573 RepID=A0A377TVF0_KLEPN|nr:methionine ABC transporter substrate-binding protein [Klebsiella pneumoniae]
MNCWPVAMWMQLLQHVPYLKDQEKALGKTFAVAATVHIEPLGIYSHKHKDFSSLPEKRHRGGAE